MMNYLSRQYYTPKPKWMHVGKSDKGYQVDDSDRIYAGSKGIGRFALSRLGKEVTVNSKKSGCRGVKWRSIEIAYIDDHIDLDLSYYLDSYINPTTSVNHEDMKFRDEFDYEQLLNSRRIKDSNIIVIDSKLFENNHVHKGKFTGEEFGLILKKVFPFIEVVVITQNEAREQLGVLPKFKSDRFDTDCTKHYELYLKPLLDDSISKIMKYRNVMALMQADEESISSVLVQSVEASLKGIDEYSALTDDKIDELIAAFNDIMDLV